VDVYEQLNRFRGKHGKSLWTPKNLLPGGQFYVVEFTGGGPVLATSGTFGKFEACRLNSSSYRIPVTLTGDWVPRLQKVQLTARELRLILPDGSAGVCLRTLEPLNKKFEDRRRPPLVV
jgi:hypothetical protein